MKTDADWYSGPAQVSTRIARLQNLPFGICHQQNRKVPVLVLHPFPLGWVIGRYWLSLLFCSYAQTSLYLQNLEVSVCCNIITFGGKLFFSFSLRGTWYMVWVWWENEQWEPGLTRGRKSGTGEPAKSNDRPSMRLGVRRPLARALCHPGGLEAPVLPWDVWGRIRELAAWDVAVSRGDFLIKIEHSIYRAPTQCKQLQGT